MNGIIIGIGVLIIIAGVAMGFSPMPMATTCTASPYKSVVFTGQVTDATTGAGIASATIIWSDPPNSNNQIGGQTQSTGYYYIFGQTINPMRGCDTLEVLVYKIGSGYLGIDQTFQLPDNACNPVNSSCNSVTIGSNYALAPSTPLVAAFSYSASSLIVTFTDKSTGSPTAWTWTFGDGQNSYLQNPVHTYSGGGTYNVTLTAYRSLPSATSKVSQIVNVVYGQNNQGTTPAPSCPTGYTGTYPNCVPPSYKNTGNTNNTTNKTYTPPPTNIYKVSVLEIIVIAVGAVLVMVGLVPQQRRRT